MHIFFRQRLRPQETLTTPEELFKLNPHVPPARLVDCIIDNDAQLREWVVSPVSAWPRAFRGQVANCFKVYLHRLSRKSSKMSIRCELHHHRVRLSALRIFRTRLERLKDCNVSMEPLPPLSTTTRRLAQGSPCPSIWIRTCVKRVFEAQGAGCGQTLRKGRMLFPLYMRHSEKEISQKQKSCARIVEKLGGLQVYAVADIGAIVSMQLSRFS
jgi:hypothetical protein